MAEIDVAFTLPEDFAEEAADLVAEYGLSRHELAREAFMAYISGSRAARAFDVDTQDGVTALPGANRPGSVLEGDEEWLSTVPPQTVEPGKKIDAVKLVAWIEIVTVPAGTKPTPGAAFLYVDDLLLGLQGSRLDPHTG